MGVAAHEQAEQKMVEGGGGGARRVALVAGVSGIVGASLAELLLVAGADGEPAWKVYGVARRPRPAWLAHLPIHYVQCDLQDPQQTSASLSALTDVTHLFYVTWTSCGSDEADLQANVSMLRHTLDALPSTLQHVCLQTGIKHYLGTSPLMWRQPTAPLLICNEDAPRLPDPYSFYYGQEDLLQQARAAACRSALTCSVHRPGVITGVSPASQINFSLGLATYASICKHHQPPIPFHFPGPLHRWESHVEFCDADLAAEQQIWAATHRVNEALNTSNGDSTTWKALWPSIARSFDLDVVPSYTGTQPFSVVDTLRDKAQAWDTIVSQHDLLPTRWDDLISAWYIVDVVLNILPLHRATMTKSAKLGFLGSCDTLTSLLSNFDKMRKLRVIPAN